MDFSQNKIILHNMTLRGIEAVPGILDFDQRGLVCAKSGDVILTKSQVDPDYLSYLEELGWNFYRCTFLNPTAVDQYTYNSIFTDKKIVNKIKSLKNYYLDTYNLTFEEKKFAKKTSKLLYGNASIAERYGTKSGFRILASKLKLNVVEGFERIRNIRTLEKQINVLFSSGKKELVVKIDEAVSGAGSTRIKIEDYNKFSRSQKSTFLKGCLYKLKQIQKSSGVVVEEWLQNAVASPSIQVQVFTKKNWKIVSMHDQILEGKEKWYVGCMFPQSSVNPKKMKSIIRDVKTFTNFLVDQGFVGFFGLDMIISRSGKVYWVEANIRKPATFYPRIIAEKVNKNTLDGIYYIATDFTVPQFKGAHFSKLKKVFEVLLFPAMPKKEGVILYNVGGLKDAGRFDLICIGKTKNSALKIFSQTKKIISKIKSL